MHTLKKNFACNKNTIRKIRRQIICNLTETRTNNQLYKELLKIKREKPITKLKDDQRMGS